MKNEPLVSVLIPTYNVSEFIDEAIESILNQTYKNLEVIIVDDGSGDETYQKLQILEKADSRIKLFKNPTNLRIAETLNFALSKASGQYIARMDGDDISLPERIEKQVSYLIEHPEIDLLGLQVIAVDEAGVEIKRLKFSTDPAISRTLIEYFSAVPHFWIAKKSVYDTVGNYRIATAEDYDFLLRMATLGLKFCNHPEFLYKQRIRGGNTTTASGLVQRKYMSYIRELYRERLKSGQANDSYSDAELLKRKNTGNIERSLFNFSNKFMFKFGVYIQQNKMKATLYFILAMLFSPIHQGRYFLNKNKYNRILRAQAGDN